MSGLSFEVTGSVSSSEHQSRRGLWSTSAGLSTGFAPTISAQMPQTTLKNTPVVSTTESKAFDAVAAAKIMVSQVAVHLSNDIREKIFRSLDRLHDVDEWELGDSPILSESFKTFIQFFLAVKPTSWPSFGLTHKGRLFAVWGDSEDHINIEFLEQNMVKWTLSFKDGQGISSRVAGKTPVLSIQNNLQPYNPEHWFNALRKAPVR